MYFEFAITSNERGRGTAALLEKYTTFRGKRCLDVGCAYGGFLVAFAEKGAEVYGVDIDRYLLGLGSRNLLDNNVDAPLVVRDMTLPAEPSEFGGLFHVVICNDVIEHVADPEALLANVSGLLHDDGVAYFEIPNRHFPRYVLRDGHYQLFGITLLDNADASEYYALHAPGGTYTVGHYLDLKRYAAIFERQGLRFELLEESLANATVGQTLRDLAELREKAAEGLAEVPAGVRARVQESLERYLRDAKSAPLDTEAERREFLTRYGPSFWRVLGRKVAGRRGEGATLPEVASPAPRKEEAGRESQDQSVRVETSHAFQGMSSHEGSCNVCGHRTPFFYNDEALYRESLVCPRCLTTSRYRSIARGVLRAVREMTGVEARSIAELDPAFSGARLRVYDTQVPFCFEAGAYPLPELLAKCGWMEVQTSLYRPKETLGASLGPNVTNQNLEALTFPDNSFDILITSDVMEHVRLDYKAHWEIRRVLKSGGVYLFTVPHFRGSAETFYRVAVINPDDPEQDIYLTEKEYHGDANSEGGGALSYRSYGTEIDRVLADLGFTVEYTKEDFPEWGIYNTELFYCRLAK
jgi:2-polyprenyl-3-methyl-5-hydroxy-6-metoxy-1,4-benzoquinol methylase